MVQAKVTDEEILKELETEKSKISGLTLKELSDRVGITSGALNPRLKILEAQKKIIRVPRGNTIINYSVKSKFGKKFAQASGCEVEL